MRGLNELIKLLSNLTLKASYCIVTHRNADLDAIASAIALRRVLTGLGSNAYILLPEGLDSTSKHFIESLGIEEAFSRCEDTVGCEHYIVVDTASRDQLGCYSSIKGYALVDHHEVNSLVNEASIAAYDPTRKATSELVAWAVLEIGRYLEPACLTLLVGGILYDSKLLQLADEFTFELLSRLIRLGGDYTGARNLLARRDPIDYSEKVARLKGMSRVGVYGVGKYLVAVTCIGAFESGVLKALLDNGADIGIAIARRDEGFRVTVRVSESLVKEIGRPLGGELAQYLASRSGGSGGGHSLAGGAYVKVASVDSLFKCIREYLVSSIGGGFKIIDNGRWMTECREHG